MADADDDALREAAAHRGLKLIKSRKRKPGVGDYGHFGLTDDSGKALLGFGAGGLTASPAEIRDYLRELEVSTWAQSAKVTPYRPMASGTDHKKANRGQDPAADEGPRRAVSSREVRQKARASRTEPTAATGTPAAARPAPEPQPPPRPEPQLEIRAATNADVAAIGKLMATKVPSNELIARFKALARGGGVLVADRAGIIGCLAWYPVLGLQDPPIGRITTLIVAEGERRRGIGRALVTAALAAMVDQGCTSHEAMSDIELRNANGFYRALGFAQKSYRFVRDAGSK